MSAQKSSQKGGVGRRHTLRDCSLALVLILSFAGVFQAVAIPSVL